MENLVMIKGILLDWHGVLVVDGDKNNKRIEDIYDKILKNNATEDEIIELVKSYKKYEPLWEVLPKLKENFKICVVNNGPSITFEYWDKYYGYSEYMDFINSEMVGFEKPYPQIYEIACSKLGVNTNEVIYMDDSCGFPYETEKLDMKFIHWNTTNGGFNKFKQYLNDNMNIQL